jgi:multiple sugar transport system ATP-binding protein
VDRFTATFLGSPQINLIRGQLEATDQGLTFTNQTLTLNLPSSILKKTFTGTREVDFAVRAENAELAETKPVHLNLPVDFSEATGADIYINGTINSAVFTVRLAKSANVLGRKNLPIHLHLDQSFIFDASSGERL